MRNFIILIILISLSTGCITKRGTRLDTSNLIQLPNGTWKLRPLPKASSELNIEPVKPTLPESKPVELPPVKVRPAPITASSVVAEIAPVTIQPAGTESEPFTPTISSELAESTKLPDFPVVTLPESLGGTETTEESQTATTSETAPTPTVKINWPKLITFYLLGFAVLGLLYFGYIKYKKDKTPPAKKIHKRRTKKKSSKPKSS